MADFDKKAPEYDAWYKTQKGALVDALLYPPAHGFLVRGVDYGAELRLGVVRATDLQRFRFLLEQRDKFIGDGLLHDDDRQRHAAHSGAAVCGVDDCVHRAFQIAVLQHERVVLRLALSLNALAVRRSN